MAAGPAPPSKGSTLLCSPSVLLSAGDFPASGNARVSDRAKVQHPILHRGTKTQYKTSPLALRPTSTGTTLAPLLTFSALHRSPSASPPSSPPEHCIGADSHRRRYTVALRRKFYPKQTSPRQCTHADGGMFFFFRKKQHAAQFSSASANWMSSGGPGC
jgi:hypothetical protein